MILNISISINYSEHGDKTYNITFLSHDVDENQSRLTDTLRKMQTRKPNSLKILPSPTKISVGPHGDRVANASPPQRRVFRAVLPQR